MTMTDTPEPKAAPKRKTKKRTKRAAKPAAAKVENDVAYPGLTVVDCAKGCNADGCVISGKANCGHPRKGAQVDMSDPAAVARLQKAQKQLAMSDATKRFS
jgi:hypothetical protein